MTQLEANIGALDQEIQRMRATGRLLEQSQRASSIASDALKANTGRVTKLKVGIVAGIVIVIALSAGTCWLFWK
jgi:hypothetical protein